MPLNWTQIQWNGGISVYDGISVTTKWWARDNNLENDKHIKMKLTMLRL